MKTALALCLSALMSTLSLAQESLNAFHRISVSGSVSVTLVKGDEPAYVATGNTDKLKVEVDNGKLRVSNIDVVDGWNKRAIVTVWYTEINTLYASAGADVKHEGTMNVSTLDLSADTGAKGDLTIDAQSMEVNVGEGSVLKLDGATKVLEAKVSTGGVLKSMDLIAHRVYVSANTGASATVHATEEIEASATLGANVSYSGDPSKVKVTENLGGSVKG